VALGVLVAAADAVPAHAAAEAAQHTVEMNHSIGPVGAAAAVAVAALAPQGAIAPVWSRTEQLRCQVLAAAHETAWDLGSCKVVMLGQQDSHQVE
jgi:hypothetical protein